MRGIFEKYKSIFFKGINLEKQVLLRAFKIQRGFWARAFQNFSEKKASKTVIFEFSKSEGKKYVFHNKPNNRSNLGQVVLLNHKNHVTLNQVFF